MNDPQQDFRNAMACCASGVFVITTDGAAGRYGITMTAVVPVTDSPPTVLLCVNLQTRICPILTENKNLCINVLSETQQDAAEHFAGITKLTPEERFEQHLWQRGATGQLQIEEALAHLHGHIVHHHDVGTHRLFYVELNEIHTAPDDQAALVYYRRTFCSLG